MCENKNKPASLPPGGPFVCITEEEWKRTKERLDHIEYMLGFDNPRSTCDYPRTDFVTQVRKRMDSIATEFNLIYDYLGVKLKYLPYIPETYVLEKVKKNDRSKP